jgi:hypothetical protein
MAIPQLEATAAAGSREAASRSLDILKRHFVHGDQELKPAAREALERLAASQSASTAQKARDVLNPPKPQSIMPVGFQVPPPPRVNVFGGNFGGPNFGGQNLGGPGPNAGAFRRVSTSNINGRKSVEIDERERNVKIAVPAAGGIHVEVMDKVNAKNPVRSIDAKDLNELRRADGELARLYEQFRPLLDQPLGGMPPGFLPAAPRVIPMPVVGNQIQLIEGLLERYKQRLPTDPNAQRMIDSLEQAKQRFQELTPPGGARLAR